MNPDLYFVAGEVSGDTHGAELLNALRQRLPEARFRGLGGPLMKAQAPGLEDWLDEAAVLGLWEVLKKYGYFREMMDRLLDEVRRNPADVLVLIDYPGFNLRLAKALRQGGYTGRIAYYISPQVWAWKRGRIREMARTLDLMMCIFPFEKDLYEASGLRTEFVGHPLIDKLAAKRTSTARDPNLVGLFPGSRSREVEALFPPMVDAASQLAQEFPNVRFVTAAVNDRLRSRLSEIATLAGVEIEVSGEDIHHLMQRCHCAAIASGTATLEAACFALPYCLVYKVAWLTAQVARLVMKVDYLGIVNNLAGREIVPELLQERATGPEIARHLGTLLRDADAHATMQRELELVIQGLGQGGAHENAAACIAGLLQPEGPHSGRFG